ncbi:MAG: hypothetical protein BWX90_00493 [bacterium ADurb.Bin132]|nr:MAG: hypothetical protein BWX90_00493 [bacterium ADurb.Bin132]
MRVQDFLCAYHKTDGVDGEVPSDQVMDMVMVKWRDVYVYAIPNHPVDVALFIQQDMGESLVDKALDKFGSFRGCNVNVLWRSSKEYVPDGSANHHCIIVELYAPKMIGQGFPGLSYHCFL